MPKFIVNGIQLHYLQVGKGPDVVLLHGLGGNLAVWFLHLVDQLRDAFRITAYDLRGHGKSDMPPEGYTTAHMAEDLAGTASGRTSPCTSRFFTLSGRIVSWCSSPGWRT